MESHRINRIFNRLGRAIERKSRVMVQIVAQDGSIDAGDGLYWGMVQFREGQARTRVRAARAKPFPGALYKAKVNPDDGVLDLLDADPVTVNGFFAGLPDPHAALNTPNHGWTHHGPVGLDPVWVNPQQLLGLQTRPTDPNSLSVTVTAYTPLAFAETTFDLTSYLPSPAYQRFVIVALDETTGALAVTASTPIAGGPGYYGVDPGAPPFTASDVAALVVDHNHIRSAAVRLYYGQTAIRWADIFMDLRDLAGRRDGYLRLDDDDPTLDGLAAKLLAGTGVTLSRSTGDNLVISTSNLAGSGWDADAAPDAPGAVDDEFDDSAIDAQWTHFDPLNAVSATEDTAEITLTATEQVGDNLAGYWLDIPDTTFTVVVKVRLVTTSLWTTPSASRLSFGLVVSETGLTSGPMLTAEIHIGNNAGEPMVRLAQAWSWTDYDTPASGVAVYPTDIPQNGYAWYLRIRKSPADAWRVDFSLDGVLWWNGAIAPFETGTKFGIFLSNRNLGENAQVAFDFFRYRTTFDDPQDPAYGRATGSDIVLPTGLSTALPASPVQGAPYYETDTHRLQVGVSGSYVPVAGAFSLMPDPVGDWLLPAGYQATWITLGSGVGVEGALSIEGTAIFLGGL